MNFSKYSINSASVKAGVKIAITNNTNKYELSYAICSYLH